MATSCAVSVSHHILNELGLKSILFNSLVFFIWSECVYGIVSND